MSFLNFFFLFTSAHFLPQLVLAMGNYMNQGNQRVSGATGFRISFLTEVSSYCLTGTV